MLIRIMNAILWSIGFIQMVIVAGCLLGFLGWLPTDFLDGISIETKILFSIFAVVIVVFVSAWLMIKAISMALTRTGPAGKWSGKMLIRMLTRRTREEGARAWAVRWLWTQVGTKKLKSVRTIAMRARGIEPVRKPKPIPEHVLAETERDAYRGDNIIPIGFEPVRRAA